jgi:hypothetical protein
MRPAVPWSCPGCGLDVPTRFCGYCGEEALAPRELTLPAVVERIVHALTSIDAKTLRSAWTLLRHPGALTVAWTRGLRKPYIAPFQLFLIANVLFFAMQWVTGTSVFSSSLDSHLHHQDWSDYAQSLVERHLDHAGATVEQYAVTFDRAVVLNAKSLILLMTAPFALLLPLVFIAQRRPFMTHVAFSLHLYTFLLLMFCVALVLAKTSALAGFGGLETPWVDDVLSIGNLAACAAYVYVAIGRVYAATGIARAAKAAALSVAVAAIVIGYRFLLLPITLYAN